MTRAHKSLAALVLAVAALGGLLARGSATAATPARVGSGPLNGTKEAAAEAIDEKPCTTRSDLTINRLTALMLSIPPWELLSGDTNVALSPMSLSRWDGWSDSKNRSLYSDGTLDGYKRAHWNPGVGFWQEDTWKDTIQLNHGERILTSRGGDAVARYLRDGYCAGDATLKKRLNGNWFGCRKPSPDRCWNTYLDIYNADDSLNDAVDTSMNRKGGGETFHTCRYGAYPEVGRFPCIHVNVNRTQGFADQTDPTGSGARTPLAYPFMSYTHPKNGNKFAAWLDPDTDYEDRKEIVRWEPKGKNARYGGEWYDGTSLQVWRCASSRCWWSSYGMP